MPVTSKRTIETTDEAGNPRDPASVRAAVERRGLSAASYQIMMAVDLNPTAVAGGASDLLERSVYLGNFDGWKKPLGEREWRAVARAAYHHEVAHHWGWEHDWAGSCGGYKPDYTPLIAPPILFGWEDVDGDHVPEILSATPYGRSR
jgi:hypothetical protein